ncbi:Peroxiredoxin-5, mitochondrial [Perkinsus olseni]|uniref:Peroxiredoxin-5, mitochondrial n=1 Tax=Perkinsus olseni TaxID=32597 RepID=A0A2K8DPD1_PEROL|nr:Thioredoxin peroxidase 5 [Perkinsus olseni]KAF4670358.1 Peroxiredoxin-5, mitochondrial [Perkinsus olseni]KAF4675850.1 Peroxiredoxin-5, mitochondrial [Perkinsus olseni]
MVIAVGSPLPNTEVLETGPDDKKTLADVFGKKTGVLFGVPGAFTPTCNQTHLPSYLQQYDELKAKGVEVIACLAVNDSFVMQAWGKATGAEGKIRMLADIKADTAKALGVDFDVTPVLGNVRSKRFAAVIKDGKIAAIEVEPDNVGASCTLAEDILKHL